MLMEIFNIENLGKIYIDKIFFETNYPILFSCTNEKNDLFICVCCQNNGRGIKWLLTGTSEQLIIDMLENRITIREVFVFDPRIRITICLTDKYNIYENVLEDWADNSIFLPSKGEYLDADKGEYDDEITYYKIRKYKRNNALYKLNFEQIVNVAGSFNDTIQSTIGAITYLSETINDSFMEILYTINDFFVDMGDFNFEYQRENDAKVESKYFELIENHNIKYITYTIDGDNFEAA